MKCSKDTMDRISSEFSKDDDRLHMFLCYQWQKWKALKSLLNFVNLQSTFFHWVRSVSKKITTVY